MIYLAWAAMYEGDTDAAYFEVAPKSWTGS